MEQEGRTPQPEPLTLSQAAQRFGTRLSTLESMVNAGIITPEKDPGTGTVHSGKGRSIRHSQFWKVERALKKKEEHPQWEWSDIAHAIPRMGPRSK